MLCFSIGIFVNITPSAHDALLVVDMQNDFMPGGSLAVTGSDTIIPAINTYLQHFNGADLPIFASRDYHPADHISFIDQEGQWPPHCVAESSGAEFHKDLKFPDSTVIISKGTDRKLEAYSALDSTGLSAILDKNDISRVFVCGVATDYCVYASAKDLLIAKKFTVILLTDAIKAVDLVPGDGDKAIAELKTLGAKEITLDDLK